MTTPSSPPSPPDTHQKRMVGSIALVCLASAAGVWFFFPDLDGLLAGFWRVGLVMSALWLAMPKAGESVAWEKAVPLIVGAVIAIVASRKAALWLIPIVIVGGILMAMIRPKPKRRSPYRH